MCRYDLWTKSVNYDIFILYINDALMSNKSDKLLIGPTFIKNSPAKILKKCAERAASLETLDSITVKVINF